MTNPDAPHPEPIDFSKPPSTPNNGSSPYGQTPPTYDPQPSQPFPGQSDPSPYGGAPYSPAPYGAGQPQPYAAPVPAYGGYPGADAMAPFGRDPYTGEPLSDKSKVAAGLLQIFLGGFGVGRFYIGDNKTGGIMLGLTVLGWITSVVIVGIFIVLGISIWALVDGIMMLTGSVKDAQGRKLRS
ncbi:NINE protein [Gordonia sp. TBRC 11910]|uniref:NINE protein n=1 Tax=Gordonia asplenii TaxID=2725283 RepID=A0A848KNB9_9ACTN|nr:TM2 domain-containing protein [Gordonia asplenii]NMO00176.1 NINE protein [Gordonia asplenii]